jgi:hypothetical protein
MRYLIGGVLAIVAFYVWRMTVWASDAGGYWNLMTGRRAAPADDPANIAKMAASIKASEASAVKSANADSKSAVGGAGGAGGAGKKKMKKEVSPSVVNPHRRLTLRPSPSNRKSPAWPRRSVSRPRT